MARVLVRGVNDVGSAVAHRLFQAGFAVFLHGNPEPATTRRGMAFADAIFDGSAQLSGITAVRIDDVPAAVRFLTTREGISVVVAEFSVVVNAIQPEVLVDARMRKRSRPDMQRGLAPLTIGVGPLFVAGENVDVAIESQWGDDLGRVITHGPTRPLEGEPKPLAGHGRDRYVYTPVAGIFCTTYRIGDSAEAGTVVARVGELSLRAPLAGVLRGLMRDGVPVTVGTKVIEVDPRGPTAKITGIGERQDRSLMECCTLSSHGRSPAVLQ